MYDNYSLKCNRYHIMIIVRPAGLANFILFVADYRYSRETTESPASFIFKDIQTFVELTIFVRIHTII